MADKSASKARPATIDTDSTETILAEFSKLLYRVASEIDERAAADRRLGMPTGDTPEDGQAYL